MRKRALAVTAAALGVAVALGWSPGHRYWRAGKMLTALSSAHAADEFVVHSAILSAGIPLIEGLVNLRDLPPRVRFFAPFYKFSGVESAPARAFALIETA